MAWTEERARRYEAWDKFWQGVIAACIIGLCFMWIVDPLKKAPVLGDRPPIAGPAGNVIPLDLGL